MCLLQQQTYLHCCVSLVAAFAAELLLHMPFPVLQPQLKAARQFIWPYAHAFCLRAFVM